MFLNFSKYKGELFGIPFLKIASNVHLTLVEKTWF